MTPPPKVDAGGFSRRTALLTAVVLAVVLAGVGIVAVGDVGPGRSASDDDGDVSAPTVTSTPTTSQPVTATTGPCESVRDLFEFAGAGPASSSELDMRLYLTKSAELVEAVADAYGPIATDELLRYAATYERIVDAEIWDPSNSPDGAELAELAGAVERQLAADCDIGG